MDCPYYTETQGLLQLAQLLIIITVVPNFYLTKFYLQSYQSESISTTLCERWCGSRGISFFRFNPLLQESIPIPENASIETLINVIIQTISHIATGIGKEKIKELLKEV